MLSPPGNVLAKVSKTVEMTALALELTPLEMGDGI